MIRKDISFIREAEHDEMERILQRKFAIDTPRKHGEMVPEDIREQEQIVRDLSEDDVAVRTMFHLMELRESPYSVVPNRLIPVRIR